MLEAANQAPSAGNLQAYEIFLVKDNARRSALSKAALDQSFISEAPLDLVFCAHPARSEWRYSDRGKNLYSIQDATIACTYAMLAATTLGLGSVWVGAFDPIKVRRILEISQDLLPVAILTVGYPAENPPSKSRRKIIELVHELD